MPSGFISKLIETVDETMRNVEGHGTPKREDSALKSLRNKPRNNLRNLVTRKIAAVCLPERQTSLTGGPRSTRAKLPRIK